jgi:hypothetical protein
VGGEIERPISRWVSSSCTTIRRMFAFMAIVLPVL